MKFNNYNHQRDQEILIGRDKLNGIPLVGIDKNGNPLKRAECPPYSRIQSINKRFHEHPNYFQKPAVDGSMESKIDVDATIRLLSQSHIGRTRHIDRIKTKSVAY
jgi:deferrochelatase/peroxidase EfeB